MICQVELLSRDVLVFAPGHILGIALGEVFLAQILLFGYPAMLVICLEVYSNALRRLHAIVAFVAALNDIPNATTPMWSVPEHTATVPAVLFPVGYLFEAGVAIAVYHAIARRH